MPCPVEFCTVSPVTVAPDADTSTPTSWPVASITAPKLPSSVMALVTSTPSAYVPAHTWTVSPFDARSMAVFTER